MRLSVQDRVVFGVLFKGETDFITMTIQKDIRKKVDLTQADIAAANIRIVPGPDGKQFTAWDGKKAEAMDIDVDFTKAEGELLKKHAEEIAKTGPVTEDNYELIKKVKEL